VRGDPLAVEQTRLGEDEGARAVADDGGAPGVRRAEGVEQRRRGHAVEQLPGGDRDDVRAGQPLQPVLDRDGDAGVRTQHAGRLADQGEVEARQPHGAAVVAEDLRTHAQPETADEAVRDDDAHDQRAVLLSHADMMAEKMR
jgi:hypothetical protein